MLLVLTGDRDDDEGREEGAELYRGAFAGWAAPTRIEADAWCQPRRFTGLGEGVILADGPVEPVVPVEPGETFAVVVAEPARGTGRAVRETLRDRTARDQLARGLARSPPPPPCIGLS